MTHTDIKNFLFTFINSNEFIETLKTGRIGDEAQWLNNFGEIVITQTKKEQVLFELRTNGKNGFTSFKKTFELVKGKGGKP